MSVVYFQAANAVVDVDLFYDNAVVDVAICPQRLVYVSLLVVQGHISQNAFLVYFSTANMLVKKKDTSEYRSVPLSPIELFFLFPEISGLDRLIFKQLAAEPDRVMVPVSIT
jgi:hypothetical protein